MICESATWWAAWCSFKMKSTTRTRGFLLVLDRSWQHFTILCQKNCWGFSVTENSPSEKVFINRHRTLKLSRRLISSSTRRHSRDSTVCVCCALYSLFMNCSVMKMRRSIEGLQRDVQTDSHHDACTCFFLPMRVFALSSSLIWSVCYLPMP